MKIGIPKEIKNNEFRVALSPAGAYDLNKLGHDIFIEKSAGLGSSFSDTDYINAGAKILDTAADVYGSSDMIVKVKEPQPVEYELLKEKQILFTYLHLAADKALTKVLVDKKVDAIAYETITAPDGSLPLLIPMSQVAGRLSVQAGAFYLQKYVGGKGMLLGGVPGVEPAKVLIIGAGTVGTNAAKIAVGLGADVTVMDINASKLEHIDNLFMGRVHTLFSSEYAIKQHVKECDLLIGAVLIPGAKAPKLVTEEMVKSMKDGSVIVDVAIDQGGSIETADHPTTHENPCYTKHGVIHYAVANMPGAVPYTSTSALTAVTLPYIKKIASNKIRSVLNKYPGIMAGLNTFEGHITYEAVAKAVNLPYSPAAKIVNLL